MSIFNVIIALSKRIAASLLRDEQPKELFSSEIFDDQDKQYILDNLTKEELIKKLPALSSQINREEDWKRIKSRINVPVRKQLVWQYSAAAVFIGLLTTTYILKDTLFHNLQIVSPVVGTIKVGTDRAILTLEDGEDINLEKGVSYQSDNINSNGEEIIYRTGKEKNVISYNYLTIPRGGQFSLLLSDGTKVWLNSETKLKYPVQFIEGNSRVVELIYGEAYFDVSHSTEHNGTSFKVLNNSQEIEVLGTEFNVKAYRDETHVYTTLVNGKVKVIYSNGQQVLNPDYQTSLNIHNHSMNVTKVNVYDEISWKDGIFSFKNKSLDEIMKVLSRWYDIEVEFNNSELGNLKFNGVLGKDQEIEQILATIQAFGAIKEYQINKNVVLLK